jgi:hypothetical protein
MCWELGVCLILLGLLACLLWSFDHKRLRYVEESFVCLFPSFVLVEYALLAFVSL